jgi:hypothetical protein
MNIRSFATVCAFLGFVAACSDDAQSINLPDNDGGTGNDGSSNNEGGTPDGGSPNDSGSPSDSSSGPDTSIVADSGDGFGALRTACINEINKLRATENHAAYALWTGAAIDQCVDQQATNDQTDNSAHEAWIKNKYPTCNGNAQDECLGYGNTTQGIVACLDSMWAEKNQSNCKGCPACQKKFTQNCPNCDFYGQNGPECGHYVNMSADYFTQAACGFSTLGGNKQWAVQNFK